MASHNATGRNAHPSKAERQAAMRNLAHKPEDKKEDKVTDTKTESKTDETKTDTKTEAKTPAPAPTKGSATRARWAVCLKATPDAQPLMAADVKILSPDTVITSLVAGNPKKRTSAIRYELYGFDGKQGSKITLGALIAKGEKRFGASLLYADVAWDVNHKFIQLEVPVSHPVNEKDPAEVAEASHELDREQEVKEEAEKAA